jgi:hypothetical protein
MDEPKTRRETKKSDKEKKGGVYTSKHVRIQEAIKEKISSKK